jgi:diadenosine tetraphosphate (Ap4A) HIT family hydrolase
MNVDGCLFCRIVRDELPATVVNRRDGMIAIEDIAPKAPVHLLVIPKRHVDTFRDIGSLAASEARDLLEFVAETAAKAGLEDFRVIVNVGSGAGQTVFHLHWHVLGGRELPFP